MLFYNIFNVLLIPNHKSWGAEILRECSPPTMCHMSHDTCHVSHVRCHVSGVTCHVSHVRFFSSSDKVVKLIGGESVINGAYPV